MKPPAQATRFCSCSAVPAHVAGSVTIADNRSEVRAEAVPFESPSKDGAAATPGKFCTCSDVPTRLINDAEADRVGSMRSQGDGNTAASRNTAIGATHIRTGHDTTVSVSDMDELNSLTEMLPGETSLFSAFTHGQGGSEALLTDRRVVFKGAPDAAMLFSSVRLIDVDSVSITRSRPRRRSLIWGLIGIGASVGMWQALDGVGNLRLIIAAIVLLMSALLLADYALRPPDLEVLIRGKSGTVLSIDFAQSRAADADRFAARVAAALEALRIVSSSVREDGA